LVQGGVDEAIRFGVTLTPAFFRQRQTGRARLSHSRPSCGSSSASSLEPGAIGRSAVLQRAFLDRVRSLSKEEAIDARRYARR